MRRSTLAQAVAAAAPEHVIIASLGSAGRAWREHGGPNPTYYASDPMGAAAGLALGAALARPDLSFLLLEGDGDLCMNLGVLLTIAGAAPGNLRVLVFGNRRYETGGGQPLPAADCADLAGIAAAAGWPWARALTGDCDGEELVTCVRTLLSAPAPAVLVADVDQEDSPYGGPGEFSGAEARVLFWQQLREWERQRGEPR